MTNEPQRTSAGRLTLSLSRLKIAQNTLVKSGAVHSGKMQYILVKSDEFENSSHLI